ncbi:MAG: ABC transporter permease [Lachnospiraceae bacterium]
MKKYVMNFWNRRFLLWELVKKGIKLKYRRSYLGIFWSLLEPLMMTIVLTVVFGTILPKKIPNAPMYILCGRLLYSFFSSSTKTAMKSIRSNAGMIKKVYVPKYMYPLSSVLYNYVIFLISLLVMIPMQIYCGVAPTWHIFQAVIPLTLLCCMTYGVGLILATISVFFRDMVYLWDVILMVIMYTSAIFYTPEKFIKRGIEWILQINPIYGLIQMFRDAMFGNAMRLDLLIYSIGFSVIVLGIGNLLFYKKQDEFILQI